LRAEPVLEAKR